MAGNTEIIDSVVDPITGKQLSDLQGQLQATQKDFIDTAKAAAQLLAVTGNSKSIADLAKNELALATATEKLQQAQNRTIITQNQVIASNDRLAASQNKANAAAQKALSPYEQLNKAHIAARNSARDLAVQYGLTDQRTIAATQTANTFEKQLRAVDTSLGQSQRNVGNYGSAFTKLYGYIRTAANILPGIGISGIFLLGFDGITKVTEALGLFSTKISQAKQNITALNEVNKEADRQAGEQTTHLKYLYAAATDVVNSMDKRLLAARELQKEFPNTFKAISAENIVLGEAANKYDLLTASILENARAKAAADKISALESKKLDADVEILKIKTAEMAQQKQLAKDIKDGKFDLSGTGEAGGGGILEGNQAEKIHKNAVRAVKDQNDLKDGYSATQRAIESSVGGKTKIGNALADGKDNTPTPTKGKTQSQLLDEQLKAIKLAETEILNSENSSNVQRIDAISDYESKSKKLIDAANNNKIISETEASNKLKSISQDANTDRIKIQKEINAEFDKLLSDRLKHSKAGLQQEISEFIDAQNQKLLEIESSKAKQERALAEQYASGKINTLQYNKALYDIEATATQARINLQIAGVKKVIEAQSAALALGFGDPKELEKSLATFTKLEIDGDNAVTKVKLDNAKKVEEARQRLKEKEKELASTSLDLIKTIIDGGYQRQLDALQAQSDKVSANADLEKETVNRSLDTQTNKARRIAIIDAQTQAKKEQIAERERQLKRKQAETDRALSIVKIIEQTAIAVTESLPNLLLAGIVAAIGAVEIATVLATPLPAFEKGGTTKGGALVWGEKGTELAIEPSGRSYLSPNTATIATMPAGTRIIPHNQLRPELLQDRATDNIPWQDLINATKKNKPIEPKQPRNNYKEIARAISQNAYENRRFK